MMGVLASLWRQRLRPAIEQVLGPSVFSPSPRERGLAALLGATFAAYGALVAYDFSFAAQTRAETAMIAYETARREAAVSQQDLGFLVERQIENARRYAFEDRTFAIAQIKAQAEVDTLAQQAGIANARVTADGDIDGEGRLRIVNLTVEGRFEWPSFIAFVQSLAQPERSFGVLSVSVDNRSITPTFRMRLAAPVLASGEA